MEEIKVKIPRSLENEKIRIEREISELVSSEEKLKMLAVLLNNLMKGANELDKEELVKMGREIKRGRYEKLKKTGLV